VPAASSLSASGAALLPTSLKKMRAPLAGSALSIVPSGPGTPCSSTTSISPALPFSPAAKMAVAW